MFIFIYNNELYPILTTFACTVIELALVIITAFSNSVNSDESNYDNYIIN